MNKALMYSPSGLCIMCGADRERSSHEDDCPGKVVEDLVFAVRYSGSHCTRGCCGSSEGEVTSTESFEACVAELVGATSQHVRPYYECRLSAEQYFDIGPLVTAERARQRSEKETKERQAREVQAQRDFDAQKSRDFAVLTAEKNDLTPEAYDRRWREIEERVRT